jgi:MFS family permease
MLLVVALLVAAVAAVRGMWSPCGLSMLSSLNPVSERSRGNRFWLTASWYVGGAALGGALLGVVCGGLAELWRFAAWPAALAVALLALVSDSGAVGWSLPDHPRQVDERWLVKYRRWIYAAGYGVQIGSGFATYIMTAAVYLTAVLAVLTGSVVNALLVCIVFGVVRGLTIAVAAFGRTPDRLRVVHRRIAALDGTSLRLAMAAEVAVLATAALALGGAVWAVGALVSSGAFCVLVARHSAPLTR